jgi:uncharacterized protein YceH (UPF0502 family)
MAMANYNQTSVHFNAGSPPEESVRQRAERLNRQRSVYNDTGRNDVRFRQEIQGRIMEDDQMRGFDRNVEQYMERFAVHLEDAMRRQEAQNTDRFEMINAKHERDVSELQTEIENLTERFDSVDYYAEEDVPKAA